MSSTFMNGTCLRSTPFRAVQTGSRSSLVVEANKKVQKRAKVILTKPLVNVGEENEIKMVPLGFCRNYLLPRQLAKVAGLSVLQAIQAQKDEVLRKKQEEKAQAQAFANALATIGKFLIKKKVGEKDQIFGSVSVTEVSDAIYLQTGRDLKDAEFTMPEIKTVGSYECSVRLHPEVVGTFSIIIQREKNLTIKVTKGKK